MSVSGTSSVKSWAGDGSTTVFNYPYEYRSSADLKVVVVGSDNVAALKTLTTHYTVSGTSDSHGGYSSANITMLTAPSSSQTLVVYRSPSQVQEANLESDGSPLYAANNALDYLTYLAQHFGNRGLQLPIGSGPSVSPTLPDWPDDDGLSYWLSPNSTRNGFSWVTQLSSTTTASSAWAALITGSTLPFQYVAPSGTDDTSTIQTALTAGKLVLLASGQTYYISARLNITSAGTGLVGDGTPLIVMLAGSGKFDNSSALSGNRYGTNAVGVYASSIARPICKGVRIKYETQTDDRYVKAIAFRSCTDILIEEVEAWNFTKALGVVYVGACVGGSVSRNYIHDCTTDSATTGQITGIEFDNDDTASSQIDVDGNRIEDLTVGASFLGSYGYQTDGINVVKVTTNQIRMRGNHIKNVGEGFDHYGLDCEITDNHVEDCYNFGVKLVHGASRNLVACNTIRDCGISGVDLDGSSSATQDTADNLIIGNYIYNIDPDGNYSGSETAGIRFNANGGTTYLPRRNHIIDNLIDGGSNGKWGVLAAASTGTLNYVLRNRTRNTASGAYSLDRTVVPYRSGEDATGFGFGTEAPDRRIHGEVDDAINNAVTYAQRLTHTTTGTPANNIGVGVEFEVETGANNNEIGAVWEYVAVDTTSASEDFDAVLKLMTAGAAAAEKLRVKSTGQLDLPSGGVFRINSNQVVGAQQSAIANLVWTYSANDPNTTPDSATTFADGTALVAAKVYEALDEIEGKVNAILAALRAHGLIAT